MTKHPRDFGFELGVSFRVTPTGGVVDQTVEPGARQGTGYVYVAWLSPREQALKIGFTSGALWARWSGIVRVMNALRGIQILRPNEWADQERLVQPSLGQHVTVWFKAAQRASIDYATSEGFPPVSLAEAEERFLDWYYAPLFGRALGPRRDA